MHCSTATDEANGVRSYSLFSCLEHAWLKLPLAAVRDVGAASQSLATLARITNKETFTAVEKIAASCSLPCKTVRNHLATLAEKGWIVNDGRGKTRTGAPRRTCTLRLTSKTINAMSDYAF